MILAVGLYAHFVDAAADVTRLNLNRRAVGVVVLLFGAKFAAMGLLGELVAESVVAHRSTAYALFLGMTLAGTPVLWRVLRGPDAGPKAWAWSLVPWGVVLMALLAAVPKGAKVEAADDYTPARNVPLDAVAGAAAYSAMVLPGVSGGRSSSPWAATSRRSGRSGRRATSSTRRRGRRRGGSGCRSSCPTRSGRSWGWWR